MEEAEARGDGDYEMMRCIDITKFWIRAYFDTTTVSKALKTQRTPFPTYGTYGVISRDEHVGLQLFKMAWEASEAVTRKGSDIAIQSSVKIEKRHPSSYWLWLVIIY